MSKMLDKSRIKSLLRESLRMTFDAIRQNKLRSILTLLGISVGVFSVIGVMTAIRTLETSIESGLNVFGANTFLVSKEPRVQFRRGRRSPYRNRKNIDYEQFLTLKELAKTNRIEWCWIKGHSDNPMNDLADQLAKKATPI